MPEALTIIHMHGDSTLAEWLPDNQTSSLMITVGPRLHLFSIKLTRERKDLNEC